MKLLKLVYTVFTLFLFSSILLLISCKVERKDDVEEREFITFGAIGPLSGKLATFGEGAMKGVMLAVDDLNKSGGVLDKKLVVRICDDGGTPEGAKRCFEDLTNRGIKFLIVMNSFAVVDGICEGAKDGSCPAVVKKKVLIISPAAASPIISKLKDDGYIWRLMMSDVLQAKVLANYIYDKEKKTNIAVINAIDAFANSLADLFAEMFTKKGGRIISHVRYPREKTEDFSPEVTKLYENGDPEGILLISYNTDTINILSALASYVREKGKDKPALFGCISNKMPDVSGFLYSLGMKGTAPSPPHNDPDYLGYVQSHIRKYGKEPGPYSERAYDAVFVLALGIERVGVYDPELVKEVLIDITNGGEEVKPPAAGGIWENAVSKARIKLDINYKGVSGEVDFNKDGDIKGGIYQIWEIISNTGRLDDFKTREFVPVSLEE